MNKKEINVTYETIFEILRREKSREELQPLPESFFQDVRTYLREKQQILREKEYQTDIFGSTEREKLKNQIKNANKILKELYERREKKIILMALQKTRTGSDIIDKTTLYGKEIELFDDLVNLLNDYRNNILMSLLNPKTESENLNRLSIEEKNDIVKLQFIEDVSKFVGTELEEYGPYEKGERANFPMEIAKILLEKKCAKEI